VLDLFKWPMPDPPKDACSAALRIRRMDAMPDLMESPSDLILTPHGLLLVEDAPPPSPWQDVETARRIPRAPGHG